MLSHAVEPNGLSATESSASNRTGKIGNLRDLIRLLDQRVPRVERAGEAAIARDAAELRRKPVEWLAVLEAE